ncbi:DUF2510 domain-containing protein [Enemella sp. A6]|uniref:DUF2510 domain-containing protein n=1 Tax=Enemella sp. A6 TaxID=3440152 RepID=UPI003EC08D7E
MSMPGWYPDPSGAPGRFRHWDGATWSAQTTDDPNIPPPLGAGAAGPAQVPPPPKRKAWPIIVGSIITAIVLIAAAVGIWRLTAGDNLVTPPEETPATAPSSEAPTPQEEQSSPPAQVTCLDSYGTVESQDGRYTSGGLTYEAVPDWGFRFDRTMFGWIDDVAAWGTLLEDDWTAGIVLGALRTENGFTELPQAADATIECMNTHGPFNDQKHTWDVKKESTTIDGMDAYQVSGRVTPGGPNDKHPGYEVKIVVVDTGDQKQFGLWMSFHPVDHTETEQQIEQAFQSLRRA